MRCARRGAQCVGQEHPEVVTTSLGRNLQLGDRVVRVETLVDQLLKEIPAQSTANFASSSMINDPRSDNQQENRPALDSLTLPALWPHDHESPPRASPVSTRESIMIL